VIDNLKSENLLMKSDVDLAKSKGRVLDAENKKLKLVRSKTAPKKQFSDIKNSTERLQGRFRHIVACSQEGDSVNTSFGSVAGNELNNTSYVEVSATTAKLSHQPKIGTFSPAKPESNKLFVKYMPKNYSKIRSVSRDKGIPKYREPVLHKRRVV
jgi:hypothetical protein